MDSKDIIARAHAKLSKDADLRWEHELRREHNALNPPEVERAMPSIVHKTNTDALEGPVVEEVSDAVRAHVREVQLQTVECIGAEVGLIEKSLEERLARLEAKLKVSSNEQ